MRAFQTTIAFGLLAHIAGCLGSEQRGPIADPSPQPQPPPTFSERASIPSGTGGRLVVADIDGDRRLDLVIGQQLESLVSLVAGNGDGTFGARHDLATPEPMFVAVADLNGDGDADLFVIRSQGEGAQPVVLAGQGNGQFAAPAPITQAIAPSALLGDWNEDGHADVILASQPQLLLRNQGNASFVETEVDVPMALSADLDGDGHADLLGEDSYSRGRGDGTFEPKQRWMPPGINQGRVLAAHDIDADEIIDLVVFEQTSSGEGALGVRFGEGGGRFAPTVPLGVEGSMLEIADFNGDALPDLAVIRVVAAPPTPPPDLPPSPTAVVHIWANTGSRTWQLGPQIEVDCVPMLVVADLDNDDKPDLLLRRVKLTDNTPEPSTVRVFLNTSGR